MKIADVFFEAQLDDGKLQVDAKKSGDKAGTTMGGQISTSLSKTAFVGFGMQAGKAAFNMLENAVGSVTGRIGDFISKAKEEEVVSARLDQALRTNVAGWDGNRTSLDAYIKDQVRYGFTATETTTALAQLVTATGNVAQAQRLLAAAQNLSRMTGEDLATSSAALTKIDAGSFRILKSIGIQLPKNATAAVALAAVEKVAAGQKEKFLTTEAGKLDVANAKWDEMQVKIGQHLIPLLGDLANAASAAFDVLDNEAHSASLIDQTKAFVALNLKVGDYEKALAGVREQYTAMIAPGSLATMAEVANVESVIKVLMDQIDAEKAGALNATSMSAAADKAFASMEASATSSTKTVATSVGDAFRVSMPADFEYARKAAAIMERGIAIDLIAGQSNVDQASKALADALVHPIKLAVREKTLQDILNGKGSVGHQLAAGLRSSDPLVKQAAQALKDDIIKQLDGLKVSIKVGVSASGQSVLPARASGGPVVAGHPYLVNENTPRSEVWVPDMTGRVSHSAVPAVSSPGAGTSGPTFQTTINYPDPSRAPEDFGRTLRRLSSLGIAQ